MVDELMTVSKWRITPLRVCLHHLSTTEMAHHSLACVLASSQHNRKFTTSHVLPSSILLSLTCIQPLSSPAPNILHTPPYFTSAFLMLRNPLKSQKAKLVSSVPEKLATFTPYKTTAPAVDKRTPHINKAPARILPPAGKSRQCSCNDGWFREIAEDHFKRTGLYSGVAFPHTVVNYCCHVHVCTDAHFNAAQATFSRQALRCLLMERVWRGKWLVEICRQCYLSATRLRGRAAPEAHLPQSYAQYILL